MGLPTVSPRSGKDNVSGGNSVDYWEPILALPVQFSAASLRQSQRRDNNPTLNVIRQAHTDKPPYVKRSPEEFDYSRKMAIKRSFDLHKELHPSCGKYSDVLHEFVCPGTPKPRATSMNKIRIGTDCSGMEAPIQALRNLKVPFRHVFSCEIDKHARTTIEANFPPDTMYTDITKRDNKDEQTKDMDLYVAGFPCQPFSTAGKQQGFEDEKGRGKIFLDIVDYITKQRPKIFILENVKGLVTLDKGAYMQQILSKLNAIGQGVYEIQHKVLNTKDHGIPQSRPRWYCVGIRRGIIKHGKKFKFPESFPCNDISKIIDTSGVVPTQMPKPGTTAAINIAKAVGQIRSAQAGDPDTTTFVVDCDVDTKRMESVKGSSAGCKKFF